MLAAVEGLIAELRQVGLPVSLSENVDAVESLEQIWLGDREEVKAALGLMLVKNHEHQAAFDTVFDLYFSVRGAAGDHETDGNGRDGGATDGSPGAGAGPGAGGRTVGALDDAALTELLLRALRDADEVMMRIIAELFVRRHAGIEPGRPVAGTYYLFRAMRAVDPDRLLARLAGPAPARLALDEYETRLDRFRQLVESEIRRRLVEDRGAEAVARTLRKPLPEDIDFLNASRTDLIALRAAIQPLARKLAARLAQKRRHKRRGALDFRRTVRRSLSTGGVPAEPVFRKPRPAKPELMVVADISGSVSSFAVFTLQLMFALRTEFARVRSYVFVDGVDEVTDVLAQAADITEVTSRINSDGHGVWLDGRSDYGHALESFWERWGQQVKGRTSVIVLGDARTNYHDPAERILKALGRQAAHVYWLNPEPRAAWDSGDSVISRYVPYCDGVYECRNIRQLKSFIEQLD
jgi:uncharacterized protein with von Willebrand factor type A (vWA) domain